MSVAQAMANFENSTSTDSAGISETSSVGGRMASLMDMEYETEESSEDVKNETEESIDDKKEKTPIKTPEKEEKKEEKKEDKKEDKKEEKKEVKKEEEKKDEEKQKRLIKYKVDGVDVEEEVDEQELINNYSGRKALQKRFTQFDIEKKSFAKEKEQFETRNKTIEDYLEGNKNKFAKVIESFEKTGSTQENPAEALFDMVDKMDLDVSKFDKAMFFHYIPLVADFLDMNDAERKAYLLEKDNGWFKRKQDAFLQKEESNRQYRAKLESENSAKRQAGITEEQFVELKEELAQMLPHGQEIDVSKVIEWKQLKPSYLRAKELTEKAGKGNVWKLTGFLNEYPDSTDEEILTALGYKQKEQEKLKEELKEKIPSKPSIKKKKIEMDEDEIELYKNFRR